MVIQGHSPLVGAFQATDHIKCRGFPGAIPPEQTHHLALVEGEGDIFDHEPFTVALPNVVQAKSHSLTLAQEGDA